MNQFRLKFLFINRNEILIFIIPMNDFTVISFTAEDMEYWATKMHF